MVSLTQRAVAAISHSGIVGVYEFGTWDSQPYMALEFCPGGSLEKKLKGTPLTPEEAGLLVETTPGQGIFLWEHRTSPHRRRVTISVTVEQKSD